MADQGELRIEKGATVIVLTNINRLYEPGWIDFEIKQRTINNTLVSDLKDIKRRFVVSYDRIYGTLFADIIDLWLENEDVTFIEVQSDLTELSFTCRIEFPDSVRRELESGDYGYTGFAFTLEEV